MDDNKRIIKNSVILYIRLIVTSILGLVITKILLEALGVSDYGLYTILGGIVIMMSFLNTVMISTTYRFIAYEMGKGNYARINQVFNISLVIHLSLALLLILFAETIGKYYILNYLNISENKINDALFVFRFSIWGALFSIISAPFQGLITAQEKFSIRASIEIIKSLIQLCAVLLVFYYAGNRIRLYSIFMMIVMVVPLILFYFSCRIKYASIIRWNFQKKMNDYKEMINFSAWTLFGASARVGKTQGSALLINFFFGTLLNASFGIANQVSIITSMFSQTLSQAAIPQITKGYGAGNIDRSVNLVHYISKYSFFSMLMISLPVLLETEFILDLWLKDVPEYTTIFIQLVILYSLIETINAGIPALIQASGKIKWFQITNNSISLMSLPISYYLFVLGFPPYYVLIVYIIVLIFKTLATLILLRKILSFSIKTLIEKVHLKILFVVILLLPIFYVNNLFSESISRAILSIVFSLLLFFIVVYFVGIEKSEREIIKINIKKVFNFNI